MNVGGADAVYTLQSVGVCVLGCLGSFCDFLHVGSVPRGQYVGLWR
jgi:hypothetical protein